jgi:hypothetical protein
MLLVPSRPSFLPDLFRRTYKELTTAEKVLSDEIKTSAQYLADQIELLPPSREKSLAITNLEQGVMWAIKALTS